jgi:hypothetical protein
MGEFSRASARRRRAALLATCAGCALPIWATPKSYIGPNNGVWSANANWTPAGQPVAGDDVTVGVTGTNKTVIYDAAATTGTLNSLTVDGSAGTIILSIATNTLSANNIYVGKTLTGRLDQSGGAVSLSNILSQLILGNDAGSNGTYNLSGGVFNGGIDVELGGAFNATGGTVAGGSIFARGALNISGSNAATFASGSILYLGGEYGNNFSLTGTLIEQGTITLTNYNLIGSGALKVDAGGTVAGSGMLDVRLSTTGGSIIAQGGNLTITNGHGFTPNSGSLQNAVGAILFDQAIPSSSSNDDLVSAAQGSIVFSWSWTNHAGHSITLTGGAVSAPTLISESGATISGFGQLAGNVTNAGSASFNGPSQIIGPLLNQALGSIVVSNNQLLVTGAVTNHGTVRAQTGGTLVFDAGLSGSGAARVDAFSGLRAPFIRQNSLSLFGNAGNPASFAQVLIKPKAQGGATSLVKSLTIQTDGSGNPLAMFDLADNALAVDYTGTSPLPGIRSAIIKAWANDAWSGPGISSSAAAGDPAKALGFAESGDVLGPAGGTFAGQGVDGSAALVRYTLLGDANLDGKVDFADLVALAQNYNAIVSSTTDSWWSHGDFNYDGTVGFPDLVKLAQNYNTALAATPIPGTSVPEPSALAISLLALSVTARRRKGYLDPVPRHGVGGRGDSNRRFQFLV